MKLKNKNDRGKLINPMTFGFYRIWRCGDINVRDVT